MRAASLLLATVLLATGCVTRTPPAPAPAPSAPAMDRTDADARLELAIYDLVNAHRKSKGLTPLILDPRINRLARLHSAGMATGRVRVGHDGFGERATLLSAGKHKGVAENVAYDLGHADPATEIVDGWLKSANHRDNIQGPYERTGVGVARNAAGAIYVTQLFVGGSNDARNDGDTNALRADGSGQ